MSLTSEQKVRIDKMSYESMLSLWRNAPVGHAIFQGETGDYFSNVMMKKKEEVGNAAAVAASKSIGWEMAR